MSNRRLRPGDIQPGVALPCDVFDGNGRLLLRLGQRIQSEEHVERLLEVGIFGDPEWNVEFTVADDPTVRVSVFRRMQTLRESLAETVTARTLQPDAVRAHATDLAGLCRLDPDAALATVLLQRSAPYGIRQMVNVGIVTELLLSQRQPEATSRLRVISAALTMNIAMLALQETLYSQREDLDQRQRAEIRMHPAAAVEQLKAAGVDDPTWLAVVGQHHESVDGTGYPERIAGDSILLPAKFVGAIDRYCAMVSERSYRPGAFPSVALRQIFLAQGKSVDTNVAALMVKEIGLYPPGTVVQLANGEIAITMKRTLKSGSPVARAILNASGIRLPSMPKRRTSQANFRIAQVHPLSRLPDGVDLASLWIPSETDLDDETDS